MPTTLASPRSSGLFALDELTARVALAGVSVDAAIDGLCARVIVAQRYLNLESTPIEAVYVFPLDEGAAVCGFEAVVDGAVIVGEVLERDAAFARYDEALERGDGGFLLDEERPDVFQASIGNLPPGAEVLIRLTYVCDLTVDAGQLRFTLPTTLTPRYAPGSDRVAVGRPDSEALNPPVAWSVPCGLDLTVRLRMPGGVQGLSSPSHPVAIALADGTATVTLASEVVALDRDFILTADASVFASPQAWAESHDGDRTVAVAFVPRLDAPATTAEVIFLVDRSGSMDGQPIAEVRNALQLCLRSLTKGCAFNIIGFGSTHGSLFHRSRAFDQESLEEASRHVAALRADLGGTELLPALRVALESESAHAMPRQVVLLTDGSVTNTDEVLELAAAHGARTRISTIGIGMAASQHLVRGVARAGRGIAEFIQPGERIEAKVVRLLGRVLSPALDVSLEWLGGTVTRAPRDTPPVFDGHRLLVYGLVPRGAAIPTAARLTARNGTLETTWEVTIPAMASEGTTLATLAARARIRDLEESAEWTGARGSRQRDRRAASVRQEIIDLAIGHGLVSRETSYVAIERRSTPVSGDMPLRRVPIALPSGWGGRPAAAVLPPPFAPSSAVAFQSRAAMDLDAARFEAPDELASPLAIRSREHRVPSSMPAFLRRAQVPTPPARPAGLDALVALQDADGSWALDARLARTIGRTLEDLERESPADLEAHTDGPRAWATMLALDWLHRHAAEWEDEWRRLADKAHAWLRAHDIG